MREWQIKRRERTRQLIELGGLVTKAGLVELASDDRALLFGAFLWIADTLRSDEGEQTSALWRRRGKRAFESGGRPRQDCGRESYSLNSGMVSLATNSLRCRLRQRPKTTGARDRALARMSKRFAKGVGACFQRAFPIARSPFENLCCAG